MEITAMLFTRRSQARDEEAMDWLMRLNEHEPGIQEPFYAWLRRSPRHVQAFLAVAETYSKLDALDRKHHIDVEELIAASQSPVVQLHQWQEKRAERDATPPSWTATWRLVAAVAVLAVAGLLTYPIARDAAGDSGYRTTIGEQREIKLDDGSLVRMNTNSKLSVAYTSEKREVRLLDGEALFVVARDAQRPFVVVADKTRIRALGTQFNVYRRGDATMVSVLEGAVQIASGRAESAPAIPSMTAGEQAIARRDRVSRVAMPDVQRSVAWQRRELVFQQTPLAEVAAEFNRYNRQQLRVTGVGLERKQISGIFSADYPQSLILFLRKDPALEVREMEDSWIVAERPRS
jgi:transmembrane sensor